MAQSLSAVSIAPSWVSAPLASLAGPSAAGARAKLVAQSARSSAQGLPSLLPAREGRNRHRLGLVALSLGLAAARLQKRKRYSRSSRAATRLNAGPRVAVIGAGPAGLAAALALRKEAGLQDVTVFERSAELRPGIGGGVQLHSGAALLDELGVDLAGRKNPLKGIRSRAIDGSPLLELDLPALAEKFRPFTNSIMLKDGSLASCTIMRDALLQAMAEALPEGTIRLGCPLKDIRLVQDGNAVECQFGDSAPEQFDLVVAADGIGSLARQTVTEEEVAAPAYTGLRIQYGVREAGGRPAGSEQEAHQWFGDGTYALTASYGGIGGKRFEMLAVVFRDESPAAENANWNPVEVRESCLDRLRKSGHVQEVLDVAEGCSRFF
ncbi:unnamed protein product, partial [Polarella glacialis]